MKREDVIRLLGRMLADDRFRFTGKERNAISYAIGSLVALELAEHET